jgi:hypothetical protein
MSSPIRLELTDPQYEFVSALESFPCFCGGFGAGKTAAAITRALYLKFRYPLQNIAYYLPTYDLVRQIAFPRFEEALETVKVKSQTNRGDNVINVSGGGKIIFRTMDQPARIVGYEVADSLVDELDTLKQADASDVWNKIIARNRQKKPDQSLNTVGVATTPEGFRFVYERWKKKVAPGYRLIKASTYSNARNLPAGYIQSLRDTYSSNLLAAYLDGEFVNLTVGSIYAEFDRHLNASSEALQEAETVHVGMDFNVGRMAAVVHVLRKDNPHAIDEVVDALDTPAMAVELTKRFKSKGHPVIVYPDSSGKARKSNNASESDLSILREAGFSVYVNRANPAVKDRILAMNAMIHKAGARRYRVNVDKCPHYVEYLEKQPYAKNGEPDKSSGMDHLTDAGGYFIAYRYPISRPAMSIKMGFAQ